MNSFHFGFCEKHWTVGTVAELIDYKKDPKKRCVWPEKKFHDADRNVSLQKSHGIQGPTSKSLENDWRNRMECMDSACVESETLFVSRGIPQGSVLVLFLQLICINKLKLSALSNTVIPYADDKSLISNQETSHLENQNRVGLG